MTKEKADYGVDGWPFVVGLFGLGAIGVVASAVAFQFHHRAVAIFALAVGVVALVPAMLGLRYVRGGKERHRDRLLDRVAWRGDERTLDVGTGGGLMLIGAAKRAPRGRSFGIDIWDTRDLSGNMASRVKRNAQLEGVAERVEVLSEDVRKLSFADDSFDVVFATLCLHNVEEGQSDAIREIARVLRPDGMAVISDLADTRVYLDTFRALGFEASRGGLELDTFPFQRVVVAKRRSRD